MLIGKEPAFVKLLGPAWQNVNHIRSREELKACVDDCILIAFDLEGWVTRVSEVGLATLRVSPAKPLLAFQDGNLGPFQEDNLIAGHTVMISEYLRDRTSLPAKYSDNRCVSKDDIERTLHEITPPNGSEAPKRILVGYDLYTEFEWVAQVCPSFLENFDYWVDVQELVEEACGSRPSLSKLMASPSGKDPATTNQYRHRAAVDAVKSLAVTSILVSDQEMNYKAPAPIKLHPRTPRKWEETAFRARITAEDGDRLPARISTPRSLAKQFSAYDLKIAFVDERKLLDGRAEEWWMAVYTEAKLDELAEAFDHSVIDGQELKVEKLIAPWVKAYHGGTTSFRA